MKAASIHAIMNSRGFSGSANVFDGRMTCMQWLANTAFGLEGQTNKDLKRLGIENTQPQQTGGVLFEATPAQAFAAMPTTL